MKEELKKRYINWQKPFKKVKNTIQDVAFRGQFLMSVYNEEFYVGINYNSSPFWNKARKVLVKKLIHVCTKNKHQFISFFD